MRKSGQTDSKSGYKILQLMLLHLVNNNNNIHSTVNIHIIVVAEASGRTRA